MTPWDVVDWISLGISLNDFIQDPTLENLGWLILDALGAALPVLPALGNVQNASELIDSATDVLRTKSIFAKTPSGSVIPIPKGMEARVADNGQGIVFQRPGAPASGQLRNRDMVRIMDPTSDYPNGRMIYYDQHGNPLDRHGVGGKPREDWHHGLGGSDGPLPGYREWYDRLNN